MPSRQLDPENESDRIQLLSKLDLFAQLNEEEISDISRGLVKHRFQADTVIVSLNEPGDSMFVLMEGLVDVFIENEKKIKAKVATLSPGNYFGEMSLLTGENRSATITAVTDVFVVEITRNHFDKIIRTRKGIIEKISEVIAARKDINEKILSELPQSKAGTNEDVKLGLIRSIKAVFNIK
jgi:CRP-like cAMP-binding protein